MTLTTMTTTIAVRLLGVGGKTVSLNDYYKEQQQ